MCSKIYEKCAELVGERELEEFLPTRHYLSSSSSLSLSLKIHDPNTALVVSDNGRVSQLGCGVTFACIQGYCKSELNPVGRDPAF